MRTILYFILLLSFVGCFPTSQLHLTDMSTEVIALPFRIDSLTIIDTRESLQPMNWDVPFLAAKSRKWIGNPKLSELNRNDIERIILRSGQADGLPVIIEFSVLEGECILSADFQSTTEYAKFKGQLKIEIPSRQRTYTSNAEMFFSNPSTSGSEKGTMKLYNQAFKNATHYALKQIRDEIKI